MVAVKCIHNGLYVIMVMFVGMIANEQKKKMLAVIFVMVYMW